MIILLPDQCDNCSGDDEEENESDAQVYCEECCDYLCNFHITAHKKSRNTRLHPLTRLCDYLDHHSELPPPKSSQLTASGSLISSQPSTTLDNDAIPTSSSNKSSDKYPNGETPNKPVTRNPSSENSYKYPKCPQHKVFNRMNNNSHHS